MAVTYEYVVETLDWYEGCSDNPDIVDTIAFETLKEASELAEMHDGPWRVCLRRDRGNDVEGLIERDYAYPDEHGLLTGCFESGYGFQDGPPIPKHFLGLKFPMDDRRV